MEQGKRTRRDYLRIVGSAAVGLAVGSVAVYLATRPKPEEILPPPPIILRGNASNWHEDVFNDAGTVLKNNHPDLDIEIKVTRYTRPIDLRTMTLTQIYGGNAPEISTAGGTTLPITELYDAMIDITDYVKDEIPDFLESALDAATFNNRIYGLPFNANVTMFFYNKKMFRDAGITEIPETLDELKECAKTLKESGSLPPEVVPLAFHCADWGTAWDFMALLWSHGGKVIENKKPSFNSSAGVNALQYLVDFMDEGYSSEAVLATLTDDLDKAFLLNKYAMLLAGGQWIYGAWWHTEFGRTLEDFEENFGASVIPRATEGRHASLMMCHIMASYRQTKYPDLAVEWLKIVTGRESHLKYALKIPTLSTRKSVLAETEKLSEVFPKGIVDTLSPAMEAGRFVPAHLIANYPKVQEIIVKAIQEAVTGKKTAQEALDDAATEAAPFI